MSNHHETGNNLFSLTRFMLLLSIKIIKAASYDPPSDIMSLRKRNNILAQNNLARSELKKVMAKALLASGRNYPESLGLLLTTRC